MIRIKQATRGGWIECCDGGVADLSYPNSDTRRGRVEDGGQISPTVTCANGLYRINEEGNSVKHYRIRKLTENECFKLMGFTSEDCQKCKDDGMSKTQLYKQSGNSIVTNCIQLIWEHIYKSQYDPSYATYDENFTQAVTV